MCLMGVCRYKEGVSKVSYGYLEGMKRVSQHFWTPKLLEPIIFLNKKFYLTESIVFWTPNICGPNLLPLCPEIVFLDAILSLFKFFENPK